MPKDVSPHTYLHPDTGERITVNADGGHNSDIGVRYDLLPAHALELVARNLAEGAKKYLEWNWLRVSEQEHVNHALNHLMENQYLNQNQMEEKYHAMKLDALVHAATRALMALEIFVRKEHHE